MAGGANAVRATVWALLILAFCSWCLAIIGQAGLQRQCYFQPPIGASQAGRESYFAQSLPVLGICGLNRTYDCTRLYSYYWFMLAFEIVSLLGLAVLSCVRLLAASALSWMAWLTVLSLLFIQGSDTFLAITDIGLGATGEAYPYSRLTAAGWILTACANLGLVFALGWRPRRIMNAAAGGNPLKY